MTKKCISCEVYKPKTSEFFFFRNKKKGWLSSWCKQCRSEKRKNYSERELLMQRARRGLKPCSVCGTNDLPKGCSYCDKCKKSLNRERKRIDKAIYRSRLKSAMPPWACRNEIRNIYKSRPEGYHVDHIVPLRGVGVCGLHVAYNLQIITEEDNMKKSNHYSFEWQGRK